jgi:RNA polymerase sigma factor (sigma-70 family)
MNTVLCSRQCSSTKRLAFSSGIAVILSSQSRKPLTPHHFSRIIITQHSLVARLQDSPSDSDWKRFYGLYEKPILAFAAARSLNEMETYDVLQEIMVKMLRGGFSRFDPAKGKFTGFLFHVANGCVIDAIRRRALWHSRHVAIDGSEPKGHAVILEGLRDEAQNPADAAERKGQLELALVVLRYLKERKFFHAKTVDLFTAVTFDHKDPKDAAAAFGTTVGNVYEAKRAVLAKLRLMLRALDEGFDLDQALTR